MPDAPRPPRDAPTTASGPRLVTDPAALERRACDLADQNVSFRAWVKFRCDLTDAELEALVRATTDEVWSRIDCTTCGQCCRVLSIALDDEDIARLAKRLGLSAAAFSRRYVSESAGEKGFATQPCPFLVENACSVYEDRPKACRDFPYLHAEGFRHRMLILIDFSLVCPVVFNTLEALKRKLPWGKKARKQRARATR